jgi:phage shock protein E
VSGRLVPALIALAMTGTAVAANLTPAEVAEQLRNPRTAPFLLDVRTSEEFAEGHVPGAKNVPVRELDGRLADIPKDRPVVVYCHSGGRAKLASNLLRERGYTNVVEMTGSMMAWEAAQLPVER